MALRRRMLRNANSAFNSVRKGTLGQTCMSDPSLVVVLGWLTSRPARGSPFTPGLPTFGL